MMCDEARGRGASIAARCADMCRYQDVKEPARARILAARIASL
jgi:ribosome modulation factor